MAKTKGPLLSFGAIGAVGKTVVYDKWKGRSYARKYAVPSNPKTAAQIVARTAFAFAGHVWEESPGTVKVPWDWTATLKTQTGRNAFQGAYMKNNKDDTDLTAFDLQPGARGGLPLVSMIVTPVSLGLNVSVVEPNLPAGWSISAGVAQCIRSQNPQVDTLYDVTGDLDLSSPYLMEIDDLIAGVEYEVYAWLWMKKPDLSPAYGPAMHSQGTPLV